jgi:hypothetical protein
MPELKHNETLARLWEETDKKLRAERLPNQEDWKNVDRQRGLPIDSNELVRRIRKMSPFLWVEDSLNCPGHAGFYFSSFDGQKQFSGAHFKKGTVFEFSRIYVDAADRPVAVEYGWREVLHRLLKKKLIKWKQMVKVFPIYNSVRSEPFDRQTQPLKEQT